MEISGQALCQGTSALKPYENLPRLQRLIPSVAYLINGANFRPSQNTSQSGRFSLRIRPLSELMDMYHTRKATDRRDKVYALLGMCSDDPSAKGLSANYKIPWGIVFRKLVSVSLSDQLTVNCWDEKEVAVIEDKCRVLGRVLSVRRHTARDHQQSVEISWTRAFRPSDTTEGRKDCLTFQASAKPVWEGDIICLLRGASRPSIIRPQSDFSIIIIIAVPISEVLRKTLVSTTTYLYDILLVWALDASLGTPEDPAVYQDFISSQRLPKSQGTKFQYCLDKAARLWNIGLLQHGAQRYEKSGKSLQEAIEAYGAALEKESNTCPSRNCWRGADEERMGKLDRLFLEDDCRCMPLCFTARNSFRAMVKRLLDSCTILEDEDDLKQTLLSWATKSGHEAVVRLLLDNGADIEAKDGYHSRTPMSWAAEGGHEAVARLLLDEGADIEAKDAYRHWTPLLWAADRGHEAVVRLLLDRDADIEAKDSIFNRTPLLWAAERGHDAVVRQLLDRGADIEVRDTAGYRTPLLWAAEGGHESVTRLLLDKGADIEAEDFTQTSLSRAAAGGHESVTRLLLDKGADIEAKDTFYHRTPLLWAAKRGHKAIVQLLLDRGADIETVGNDGRTPLSLAAERGHEAVVRLLKAYTVDQP
jgi:ankyrin repeat protein